MDTSEVSLMITPSRCSKINLPSRPSFLYPLATSTVLPYKTSECKLRFLCTQSVLPKSSGCEVTISLPLQYLYVCAMSQVSVQSTNGEFKEEKQDIGLLSSLTLIFPSGEVAKIFSSQTKSSNKTVSGIERSSVSFLLKCLCELRKLCPF